MDFSMLENIPEIVDIVKNNLAGLITGFIAGSLFKFTDQDNDIKKYNRNFKLSYSLLGTAVVGLTCYMIGDDTPFSHIGTYGLLGLYLGNYAGMSIPKEFN